MGWKVVTIIGAYGWQGSPGDLIRPKKKLRTVDGPLLRVVTTAYHLHVFLSPANLNIQKSLKHSNKRRGKAEMSTHELCSVRTQRASHRQQDEPSSPSRPPEPERANTNCDLNMQTEKYMKEPNSAPARGVLWAQVACRETRLKSLEHQTCLFLLLYRHIHNYIKIPVFWRVSLKKLSVMS